MEIVASLDFSAWKLFQKASFRLRKVSLMPVYVGTTQTFDDDWK